jgi:hypothetical protein
MRTALSLVAAGALLAGCGFAGDSGTAPRASVLDPQRPLEAVPRAICGAGSRTENGLQGQVPRIDRESGRSQLGYTCNLELVGQAAQGEGASWQFAWYDDCGYYGTLMNPQRRTQEGSVVVDARDPARPFVSAVLSTPAMMDPHEALKVNEKRALLAAVELSGGSDAEPAGEDYFDVYDVSRDCAHPQLLASVPILGTTGHEGEWAPQGDIYYGSGGSQIAAIDVTDPTRPELITQLRNESGGLWSSHGLNASTDGRRGYVSILTGSLTTCPNAATGMAIIDLGEVQDRKPNAVVPKVGEICWTDGAIGQHTIPITSKGKPYVVYVEEGGRGAARIIDISDEANPAIVSRLKLEVHLDENAQYFNADGGPAPIFIYDGHYCAVDRAVDPTVLGCGYFESGIRVFDIRDVTRPVEIAYYNPPALPGKFLPGSSRWNGLGGTGGTTWSGTADHCSAQVRFIPERGELWTQCQDNEFMVLRFTNGVWPFEPPARKPRR